MIAAEGEHKASRALRQAAEVIMDNPAALQLRYLQTLNSISAENNSTIIFPVPIDIMSEFMNPSNGSQVQYGGHSGSASPPQQVTHHQADIKEDPNTRLKLLLSNGRGPEPGPTLGERPANV